MANEATKIELRGVNNDGEGMSFTVADANAVSKGTLMVLIGDRTASASTTTSSGAMFAGIAWEDKEAGDGVTRINCVTNGVFDLAASGAITLGHKVILAGTANYVQAASVNGNTAIHGNVVGVALETASDGEVIAVDIGRK